MTDRRTEGQSGDRQMSIARCDLTKLEAHKNVQTQIARHSTRRTRRRRRRRIRMRRRRRRRRRRRGGEGRRKRVN